MENANVTDGKQSSCSDYCPLLWAKTDEQTGDALYHPLIFHMLDVAAVAGIVWEQCLPQALCQRLERSLGIDDSRRAVMFWAGAHDIGKACPGFQKKAPSLIEEMGLPTGADDADRPHGFVTAHVLQKFWSEERGPCLLGQIVGGHHGVFPRSCDLIMGRDTLGNRLWDATRRDLLERFAHLIGFPADYRPQAMEQANDPFVVPVLAGFVTIVDWIGSNQDFFPCIAQRGKTVSICEEQYWPIAQHQAHRALEKLGWLPSVTFAKPATFEKVFPYAPNALQKTAIELATKQNAPYLMIVEAPMGHGKTEAALYAADLAMCRGFARGLYVAMPTQATGNAMFKRILEDYLRRRGHQGKLNLQLVHGDALLAQMTEAQEGEISEYKTTSVAQDEAEGDVEAQTWFTARKRPLLAPFGVGTIDQSLLSVLQTKHWFVRLFGLAGKVVIFDEVHAYDAYMSTILERLLHWLAELDCTVILLSATLPEAKRKALAKAYSGRDDAEYKRYPRITLAQARHYPRPQADTKSVCAEIPMGESHSVNIQFAKTGPELLAETLSRKLAQGGCAAVICNTVNRSIEVYQHLRDALKDTECLLFHARTLQMWRREREAEVLRKFGKHYPQDRPHRAVLVATQVIEQSLDLDFDLMVSDIAPIDLLLQRSGRLHRHKRSRPEGLETPEFIVLCDAEATGPPPESFGKSIEFVYDRYVLLRTWLALRERNKIEVPVEMETLVEAAYGLEYGSLDERWSGEIADALAAFEVDNEDSIGNARHLIVRPPDDPVELVERFNRQLEDDDDPATDVKIRAATREGEPSIRTVFIQGEEKPPKTVGATETRWLLDRSAQISQKGLFNKLLALKTPSNWASNAHLRHCRLVEVGKTKGINVEVSSELGVVIL